MLHRDLAFSTHRHSPVKQSFGFFRANISLQVGCPWFVTSQHAQSNSGFNVIRTSPYTIHGEPFDNQDKNIPNPGYENRTQSHWRTIASMSSDHLQNHVYDERNDIHPDRSPKQPKLVSRYLDQLLKIRLHKSITSYPMSMVITNETSAQTPISTYDNPDIKPRTIHSVGI